MYLPRGQYRERGVLKNEYRQKKRDEAKVESRFFYKKAEKKTKKLLKKRENHGMIETRIYL